MDSLTHKGPSLWNVQEAIDLINATYELNTDFDSFNYRSHALLEELREQIKRFHCSAGVWTQTTDVEGEVNGLLTYDRRVQRAHVSQWQADIQDLFKAAAARAGHNQSMEWVNGVGCADDDLVYQGNA